MRKAGDVTFAQARLLCLALLATSRHMVFTARLNVSRVFHLYNCKPFHLYT